MQISQQQHTSILTQGEESSTLFVGELAQKLPEILENVIICMSPGQELGVPEISALVLLAEAQKAKAKSFVVVTDRLDYEAAPDNLMVVPTLQEAHDVIEMEEIERDLGI